MENVEEVVKLGESVFFLLCCWQIRAQADKARAIFFVEKQSRLPAKAKLMLTTGHKSIFQDPRLLWNRIVRTLGTVPLVPLARKNGKIEARASFEPKNTRTIVPANPITIQQ